MRAKSLASVLGMATCLTQQPAVAQDDYNFGCRDGSRERRIAVLYEREGKSVPCEVHYITDWGDTLLWQAQQQRGYCEAKAISWVRRLSERGWTCQPRAAD